MAPPYNLGIFCNFTFYLQNAGFLMVNQDKWNIKPISSNIRWKNGVRSFIRWKWLIVAGIRTIRKISSCSMLQHHLLIFGCGEPWKIPRWSSNSWRFTIDEEYGWCLMLWSTQLSPLSNSSISCNNIIHKVNLQQPSIVILMQCASQKQQSLVWILTENKRSSIWQRCRHWWHRKLS